MRRSGGAGEGVTGREETGVAGGARKQASLTLW